MSRSQMSNSS